MSDLVAFLRARLDEDEWIAQGAARTDDGHLGDWIPQHFGAGGFDARVDDHIARHDPARVLREVQAKRKLIDDYLDLTKATYPRELYRPGDNKPTVAWGLVKYGDYALRVLAAVYSDHPDYDQEWGALSADEPVVFLTCQRSDGSEYQHPLRASDIGPSGEWQMTVPNGTCRVVDRPVNPGDIVSGRLTLD